MDGLVYCTRMRGARLPRPTQPVRGNVLVSEESKGDQVWLRATTVDERGGELLRPLIKARIRKVTAHGMIISGTEVVTRTGSSKSGSEVFPQVWWVFVLTHSAIEIYEGEDPLDAISERKRAASSPSGF